jgi:hypothetical protein
MCSMFWQAIRPNSGAPDRRRDWQAIVQFFRHLHQCGRNQAGVELNFPGNPAPSLREFRGARQAYRNATGNSSWCGSVGRAKEISSCIPAASLASQLMDITRADFLARGHVVGQHFRWRGIISTRPASSGSLKTRLMAYLENPIARWGFQQHPESRSADWMENYARLPSRIRFPLPAREHKRQPCVAACIRRVTHEGDRFHAKLL